MRKELTIAIISTVGYVLMYIIFAVIFLRGYILSNPFWFSGITNCIFEMSEQDLSGEKNCLCPSNINFNNCVKTGKTYQNTPNECAPCDVKIPPGIVAINIILLIFLVILILLWINVFTRTVKF